MCSSLHWQILDWFNHICFASSPAQKPHQLQYLVNANHQCDQMELYSFQIIKIQYFELCNEFINSVCLNKLVLILFRCFLFIKISSFALILDKFCYFQSLILPDSMA